MTNITSSVPIVGFAAFSGTGKTTLLKSVIPILKQQGYRLALIKHAHHQFDIDHPGKDSYELRKAGASQMLIASRSRWALMVENPDEQPEPSLQHLIDQLDLTAIDLILVEGFKADAFPKIEVHRNNKHDLICNADNNIIAIATDQSLSLSAKIPQLDLNNPNQVADFIINTIINKNQGTKQ